MDDALGYKHRPVDHDNPTLCNIYRILASQYDSLEFILTTRAKVLVQKLWETQQDWDNPFLPDDLLKEWNAWQSKLSGLHQIAMSRWYDSSDIHASENVYSLVAYLWPDDTQSNVQVTLIMARSCNAPKKQVSVLRLELCAAVKGAQLAKLMRNELTLPIGLGDKTISIYCISQQKLSLIDI